MKLSELEDYLYERGYITTNGAAQSKILKCVDGEPSKYVGRIWHKQMRTMETALSTIDVDEVILTPSFKELGTLILLLGVGVTFTATGD